MNENNIIRTFKNNKSKFIKILFQAVDEGDISSFRYLNIIPRCLEICPKIGLDSQNEQLFRAISTIYKDRNYIIPIIETKNKEDYGFIFEIKARRTKYSVRQYFIFKKAILINSKEKVN